MEYLEQEKQDQINSNNLTNAVGWSGLFNGFGGDSTNKTVPMDLLPYRPKDSNRHLSDSTRAVIARLKINNEIPPRIWGLLSIYQNEIDPI